jgi:crotonobetainyl-CoA:carnitine CoA-transferase CaiB-like acyl-CoA transferase
MAQMMGGLAYMTGPPGQPLRAGASIVDMTAATFAALGVLAALYRRNQTGLGEHIVGGMFETVGLWVARYLVEYQLDGLVPEPLTVSNMAQRMRWEVYDRFKTVDGSEIIIACTSDKHWVAFCDALELADWKQDPRIATKDLRMEARDWLLPAIQVVVGRYRRADLADILDRSGVPVAPVNTPADLLTDRQLLANGQFIPVEAEGQKVQVPLLPLRSNRYDPPASGQVPGLGEHTGEIIERFTPGPAGAERNS